MKRAVLTCAVGLLVCGCPVALGQTALPELPDVSQTALAAAPTPDDLGQPSAADSAVEAISDLNPAPQEASADPPKPWKLPQPSAFQRLGIDMGGWMQQGITFNSLRPADRFNGPEATNDRDREYQLNQLWLYFARPTKTDGCGWDIGGRIDIDYGTDWRFGQCFGLENRFDDPNSFYGLILPQFYLEVAYNDLTVKLGHFATFTSLEVIPAPLNFFYSHSYLMLGYFDPLLVTGVETDYKLNDHWTAVNTLHRGWQEFEDPTGTWNYLGGLRWVSDDKRSTLSAMMDSGREIGFTGVHDRTSGYLVYTRQLSEKLSYGSEYVVGREQDGSTVNPGEDANWYGTEQLLTYNINPKWSAGARYEWVRDVDGARIAGVGNLLGTARGWLGQPGFTGSFHDLSLGLNYRPHPNFVLRPEVRWDWYGGEPNPAGQLPFGDFSRSTQFTTAMDLVVTY